MTAGSRPGGIGLWRPLTDHSHALVCDAPHAPGGGHLDESARRLTHEELAVASSLVAEGHSVCALRDARGGGRYADLNVCGTAVEVKSFLPLHERGGRPPTPTGVFNKLVDAAGQADAVVLFGRGSGLGEAVVRRGLARYLADPRGTHLVSVRVMGDGFDLSWACARGRERGSLAAQGSDAGIGGPGPPPGACLVGGRAPRGLGLGR